MQGRAPTQTPLEGTTCTTGPAMPCTGSLRRGGTAGRRDGGTAGQRDRVMHPASTFTQLEGPESELHLPLAPLPNHEALVGVHFEVGGAHGALGHVGAVQFARAARQTVPQHCTRRSVLARHPWAHVSLSPLLPHRVAEPMVPHYHHGRRVVGAYKAWVILCVDVDPPRTSVSWLHPSGQYTRTFIQHAHVY